ncbi:MAG: hypothetical protein HW387_23 [Parachlamydiales bacterium]|nr:hypothetical protein [Parachlamydiales bacterium]
MINKCTQPHCSSNVTQTYKPYAGPSTVNTPSFLNIFGIVKDCFELISALIKAKKNNDTEGKFDANIRLAGIPVNAISTTSSIVNNAYQFSLLLHAHIFSNSFKVFSKVSIIPGIVLCFIEGIFESIGAWRNGSFLKSLNSQIIKEIPNLLSLSSTKEKEKVLLSWAVKFEKQMNSSKKKPGIELTAVTQILQLIRSNLSTFDKGYFRSLLEKMTETEKGVFFDIVQRFLDQIKLQLVQTDISSLKNSYLSLSSERKHQLNIFVTQKYPYLSTREAAEKINELKDQARCEQQAKLDRRTDLAKEVTNNLPEIEEDFLSFDSTVRQSALTRAEALLKDVTIQAEKKLYHHIVGIVAIAMSLIGLIFALTVCPQIIALLFITLGACTGLARYFMAKGLLGHKGWAMDYKNCVPGWIGKRIFKPSPANTDLSSHRVTSKMG